MDEKTYIENRVNDQINWLSGKSGSSQKSFKRLRLTVIILSVSIPFLTGYIDLDILKVGEIDLMKLAVGIAGVIIAAIEGIQALYKHQDKWINYRVTAESLKQEKMLYLTKSGAYASSNIAFQDFVTRVETILGGENKQWSEYMLENNKSEGGEEKGSDVA
ncbi:MAG: DUF4231 domain-containing protein [Bacteroidota bacterium]